MPWKAQNTSDISWWQPFLLPLLIRELRQQCYYYQILHMHKCVTTKINFPIKYCNFGTSRMGTRTAVVLNLFHCWDPLKATDVVWDPQVKIEKECAPE